MRPRIASNKHLAQFKTQKAQFALFFGVLLRFSDKKAALLPCVELGRFSLFCSSSLRLIRRTVSRLIVSGWSSLPSLRSCRSCAARLIGVGIVPQVCPARRSDRRQSLRRCPLALSLFAGRHQCKCAPLRLRRGFNGSTSLFIGAIYAIYLFYRLPESAGNSFSRGRLSAVQVFEHCGKLVVPRPVLERLSELFTLSLCVFCR